MDTGHAAWVLTSAALVLLMTPGLAFFYGGMTRAKSVLNMLMMSFGALAVIPVVYILWGYSESYASNYDDGQSSLFGGLLANPLTLFGLRGIPEGGAAGDYITIAFQLTFAVITAALISGAIADRAKFSTWMVFLPLWVTFSYFPLAHMVWGGGFLSGSGDGLAAKIFGSADGAAKVVPIDYAGGTVVHMNAGIAGLVLVLIMGTRRGFGSELMRPHNVPFTMLGAGLLWFGWFGFNVGSFVPSVESGDAAFVANFVGETGLVWVNTAVAAAAGILGWLLVEKRGDGKATSLGAASGMVAGLVAVTPACGAVTPVGSIALGFIAGLLCALAAGLKYRFGYDDSLDVVGVHLVGGLVGTVGVGLLASSDGLLYGGGIKLLIVQILVAAFAVAWSGFFTALIGFALAVTIGWRVTVEQELAGIDVAEHGESAYDFVLVRSGRSEGISGAAL